MYKLCNLLNTAVVWCCLANRKKTFDLAVLDLYHFAKIKQGANLLNRKERWERRRARRIAGV